MGLISSGLIVITNLRFMFILTTITIRLWSTIRNSRTKTTTTTTTTAAAAAAATTTTNHNTNMLLLIKPDKTYNDNDTTYF